jgi:hypothetical protein
VIRWLYLALWCGLWLALAAAARYGWVEHGPMAARCDQGGSDWPCMLRSAVIQAFILDRLAILSIALAVMATVASWRSWRSHTVWVWAALAASCCGLFLYSAQFAAPAALLAAVSWVRERVGAGMAVAANATSNAP